MRFKNILNAIMSAFRPRTPKTEQYITKIPDFNSLQEIMGFVNQKHIEENAELKADNIRYKSQEEEQRKEKERIKQESDLFKTVQERKIEILKMKEQKMLKLKIEGLENFPTFFLKNNKAFGKFMGFILQETDEGLILYYPWLQQNDQDYRFDKYAYRIEDFFKEEIGIVSQMRGGKLDSNFDIGEQGEAILRPKKMLYDKPNNANITVEDLKKIENANAISEHERREYEQKIASLTTRVNEFASRALEAEKANKGQEHEIMNLSIENELATGTADLAKATLAADAKHKIVEVKTVTDAHLAIQDLKVNQVLTEQLNHTVIDSMAHMRKKLGDKLYKEETEIEESRQKDLMRSVAKEVKSQEPMIIKQAAAAPAPG